MKKLFQKSNTYLSDPDVQTMLRVQKGSKEAFEELMHKYYPRILNFIYRFVGHKNTAEDLTQEVFMRVYKNAWKYKAKSKFQTWIYTIAKNVALNELRRKNQVAFSLDEPVRGEKSQFQKESKISKTARPDEEILQKERALRIRSAIQKLPENQRIALILRRYDEFSYSQIAMTLKVSDKAVKSLLSRAKQNLKKRLVARLDSD
jgi:RNA polymerase sigma-70 factor (ECF subfamily)